MNANIVNEVLDMARYGDAEELKGMLMELKERGEEALKAVVNGCNASLNTPLHMACANGHIDCVQILIAFGAEHDVQNHSGNYPLHWAVQNKHLELVKLLLQSYPSIDVLAKNAFGRGSLTEAFQSEQLDVVEVLLEHKSATEERLTSGSGISKDSVKFESENDDLDTKEPRILQETVLEFAFDACLATLKAREIAIEWEKDAFGKEASDDTTGVSIWSASLILAKWVTQMKSEFRGKSVCELGSGCGVSGLAAYMYTQASEVTLSDFFPYTVKNLEHNIILNKGRNEDGEETDGEDMEVEGCAQCGVLQRFTSDNTSGKLMLCSRCESVQYCSRECQTSHWKEQHKKVCKALAAKRATELIDQAQGIQKMSLNEVERPRVIQALAIDWGNQDTWPGRKKYDIIMGSDLVYHEDIVPTLASAVDGMLKPNGKFFHVASQQRNSLADFKEHMETLGFACVIHVVPDQMKTNPLANASQELFDLHFNEMSDVYCMYTFERK